MRVAGERAVGFLSGPEPGTTPGGASWIAAEAYDGRGERLSSVRLTGVDAYDFTAGFLAWAARHPVDGTGALGPLAAYGLQALEEGCRAAGLERVS